MKSRRTFLLGGAAALPLAALQGAPARFASRLKMMNDGVLPLNFLSWNPALPPPEFPPLPPTVAIRVRTTFPYQNRDVLETLVYLGPPDTPGVILAPLSQFHLQVDDVKITASGGNSIAFSGVIIDNPIRSPFGMIVGKPCVIGGAFDHTGSSTEFEFFGGLIVGSHATMLPVAHGSLEIATPWNSF
ncbi:MAG: hypothetical protein WHT08_14065 [Bryobacteraceae bacterium]|jgi:hypothetical protein